MTRRGGLALVAGTFVFVGPLIGLWSTLPIGIVSEIASRDLAAVQGMVSGALTWTAASELVLLYPAAMVFGGPAAAFVGLVACWSLARHGQLTLRPLLVAAFLAVPLVFVSPVLVTGHLRTDFGFGEASRLATMYAAVDLVATIGCWALLRQLRVQVGRGA